MQPPATTCWHEIIVHSTRHPPRVRRKEERCTGNLTSSLSFSIPHPFSTTPSLPTGWIKGESHRCVPLRLPRCLLRMFSPDISRSPPRGVPGMSRIVSLLSWHAPTLSSLRHTLTHLHTDLSVPSRPILAIFRVLVREREWVSGSISRWVPVFPPMGSPLPSVECS